MTGPDTACQNAEGTSPYRIAVLASGTGSNLQAIIDQLHGRQVPGTDRILDVAVLVCNAPGAMCLERACGACIPTVVVPFEDGLSLEEHDAQMIAAIEAADVELVVLAGYMRLLHPSFLQAFPNKVINLHPALLPAFPGTHSIADAFEYGVKVTGITVHFVDYGVDTGPVIAQQPVPVMEWDTLDTLAERIHEAEHELLPQVICMIVAGKVASPQAAERRVRTAE